MEAWGTKKSWTSHFNASDSSPGVTSKVNGTPVVFTDRSTASKSSPQSTRPSSSKIMRSRGIVFELEPVPMDPKIDPSWDLCFNCWKSGHSHKDCKYPKYHDYCRNCGRRDVNWTTCPRCAKGYRDYQQWRLDNNRPEYKERIRPVVSKQIPENCSKYENELANFPALTDGSKSKATELPMRTTAHVNDLQMIQHTIPVYNFFTSENKIEFKTQPTLPPSIRDSATEMSMNIHNQYSQHSALLYQQAMSDLIVENNQINQTMNGKENQFNSIGNSILSSEEEYYKIDDDNLDEMIVDEEETGSSEERTRNTVQDFVTLIELVKHLPIDTQNKVVEQFAKERRVLLAGNQMQKLQNNEYQ